MNQEMRFDINALARVKQTVLGKLPHSRGRELSSVLCDDLDGEQGWEVQGGGNMCVRSADSQQKLTTLYLYSNFKKSKKKVSDLQEFIFSPSSAEALVLSCMKWAHLGSHQTPLSTPGGGEGPPSVGAATVWVCPSFCNHSPIPPGCSGSTGSKLTLGGNSLGLGDHSTRLAPRHTHSGPRPGAAFCIASMLGWSSGHCQGEHIAALAGRPQKWVKRQSSGVGFGGGLRTLSLPNDFCHPCGRKVLPEPSC